MTATESAESLLARRCHVLGCVELALVADRMAHGEPLAETLAERDRARQLVHLALRRVRGLR